MQTDIKSSSVAASTSAIVGATRNRMRAVTIVYGTTGGTVTVTDGNGGPTLFSFPAPSVAGVTHLLLPGEGILAITNLYVTTGAGAAVVVYYG